MYRFVFLAFIAALVVPELSIPCTCASPQSVRKAFDRADVVVAGVVTSIVDEILDERFGPAKDREPGVVSSGDLIGYQFVPTDVWKGTKADTLTLYSHRGTASCGYPFRPGLGYLVYGYTRSVSLLASLYDVSAVSDSVLVMAGACSRTSLIGRAQEDLNALLEPRKSVGQ